MQLFFISIPEKQKTIKEAIKSKFMIICPHPTGCDRRGSAVGPGFSPSGELG